MAVIHVNIQHTFQVSTYLFIFYNYKTYIKIKNNFHDTLRLFILNYFNSFFLPFRKN